MDDREPRGKIHFPVTIHNVAAVTFGFCEFLKQWAINEPNICHPQEVENAIKRVCREVGELKTGLDGMLVVSCVLAAMFEEILSQAAAATAGEPDNLKDSFEKAAEAWKNL